MALREIVLYPHSALTTPAEPVSAFDDELHALLEDMAETMYHADGIGLAANQIDVLQRVTVIDAGGDAPNLLEIVNPTIVASSGSAKGSEGCLSFPGLSETVRRATDVTVEYQDRDGNKQAIEADGLLAVALQHEIDHLDGIVFTERLGPLKKKMALKRYQKILEDLDRD